MPDAVSPHRFNFFLDVLQTLEDITAPYMIIGAFAATIYGITRLTFDIDIVVDLAEEHIQSLAAAYPLPRYYADPEQMRNAIDQGTMFNIIDSTLGQKVDLVPLTMAANYTAAFARRVRQEVNVSGIGMFALWCARADDVVVGKLLAWAEGRSRKHEDDIFELLVSYHMGADQVLAATFNWDFVDRRARAMGDDVVAFWQALDEAARREANRSIE